MKSDSSSPRSMRLRTVTRFQPYQDCRPTSSTRLTRSKAAIWDKSASTNESFHTAVDHFLPMDPFHAQLISGNDSTKSTPTASSSLLTSQNASSSSPSCLTRQGAVILDTLGEVDLSLLSEPVGQVQYHVKKYACQLEAGLCNQVEIGLSEAIDFTLKIIERPLEEMYSLHTSQLQTMLQRMNVTIHLHLHREKYRVQYPPKYRALAPPLHWVVVVLLLSIVMLLGLAAVIDIVHRLLPPDSLLGITVIVTCGSIMAAILQSWGALVKGEGIFSQRELVLRFSQRPTIPAPCSDK
ncbi:hypothetical protein EV401DRAFT_1895212 [Pisolithus croceorrhizus]|nr:hypothetical protein EV401DRAFT_1895212 [Pisolithus croceorrhizus]